MVYASIKVAWGIDDFDRKPPDNPYVVKNPIQNKANFKAFEKSNFHDDLSEADIVPSKKKKRTVKEEKSVDSTQDTSGYDMKDRHQYFLDKNDEYSEVSSEDSSIAISRKIKMKKHKNPKPIIKNIREDFQNHSYRQHGHGDNCSSMLEHLQNCKICRQEVEEYSKNTFIKEFIIFAGSGIIMFLFLDLLRKIAQRSQ